MLILTRRVGETLKVGNDVDVTVLGVKGNQIRIGIKAPKNVAVRGIGPSLTGFGPFRPSVILDSGRFASEHWSWE